MADKPNVIFIYGDDLGRGMLSCYGQQHFETPNIDRLANEGMRFRQAYGCAFCAPSRASMMTGLHDCHQGTWTYTQGSAYNRLSTGEMTLAQITELIHTTGLQAELLGAELPQGKDGISFLPTLLGKDDEQQTHPFIVYASGQGPALVTEENWKLRYINSEDRFQLYNLNQDYREERDVAAAHPEIVDRLSRWMLTACDGDYQHGTPGAHLAAYPR